MKRLFIISWTILLLAGLAAAGRAESKNPHGEIKWDCQKCHTPDSWTQMRKPLTFAHDETEFPLIGSHRATRCAGCHRDLVFSRVASACADCHSDLHQGQMGLVCQKCHTSENWQNREDVINLHLQKGFALAGVHAIADCNSCHQAQRPEDYASTPVTCQGCHMGDYTGTSDPSHVMAGFSFQCESCHSPRSVSWRTVTYDHPSPFRLEGAHRPLDCNSCHAAGYAGTVNTCFGCHEGDFAAAKDPDHVKGIYDHDCATCHTVAAWSPARFDHNQSTFALTGAHQTVACNQCHTDEYTGTATECDACHQQDFANSTKPNHVTGGFPTQCQTCHTTVAWSPATFDHNKSRFVLTGAHVTATCDKCHSTGYTGTPTACYSCHQTNFAVTTDPNHVQNKFDHACEQCHATTAWSPAVFDHGLTQFPLTGAHQTVACAKCHTSGYAGTPATCYSCHQEDFTGVADPNHVTDAFEHECLRCHTTARWTAVTFDHARTSFALTGAHQTVTCNTCHATGFDATQLACYSCHQTAFAGTTKPDHVAGGFPRECQVCHSTSAWSPSSYDHSSTQFPLTGAHQSVNCNQCHTTGYAGTPTGCYSCHQSNYAGVKNPDHVAGSFDHDCLKCHSTTGWKPTSFDHASTGFVLTGAHEAVACSQCHATGYAGTATTCFECHQTNFAGVKDPNHVASNFDHDCLKCHTTFGWSPADFDHNLARFTLTGAHAAVTCTRCHATGFTGTTSDCYSCHQTDYTGVADPSHVANNFDHNCLKCHSTAAWLPVDFDHSVTGFALTGAHRAVTCNTCHKTSFAGTASACYACHQSAYAGTTQPNHPAVGFPTECQICHTTTAWTPSSFDHGKTGFVLTGAHQALLCNQCHATGYAGTPTTCYSCHQGDFAGAKSPDHIAGSYDHDCLRCHTTTAWSPASFDHSRAQFPLTGAHQVVPCVQCHVSGYAGTPTACYSCHQGNFTGVSDPNHVAANFDHDCLKCHTTAQWKPSTFDHGTTGYALTGVHQTVACGRCHTAGYAGTPTTCYSCHQSDFTGVVDPNHVTGNFDHDCLKCHTTAGWNPASFDHSVTAFALTGAHRSVTCNTCHKTGFAGTPSACFACHQAAYVSATKPNHTTSGFPIECQVCHSTSAWLPASFDHSTTGFALTGAHQAATCIQCHSKGYAGTPTACYSCHTGDFTSVTDPNHVTNNFDRDCTKCHTTAGWTPATFNHSSTTFPLTGAHLAASCIQCHSKGYAGTPTACYSCHTSDFAGVTDPNHVTNNFDRDCTKCHSTAAWTPSTFNHSTTGFTLTGAHLAATCIQCHSKGYAGTPIACYSCHTGDFTGVANPNHVTNNFDHDCTKCHSMTGWTPATFNHATTGFPLTGAHLAVTCIQCHSKGYAGTPTACYSCHTSDFTGVSDPNHVTNNFDHDCTKCHSMTGWTPATFNHNLTPFPLTGAHLAVSCIQCHASGYAGTPTACYSCHVGDFTGVADPNHVTGGFDRVCSKCHTTSAWTPATFDHNLSSFPLTGAHRTVTCINCHQTGYTGTPTICDACHHADYTGTTNPNHGAAGFPTDCQSCHTTTAWSPSTWNHDSQHFPIYSGKHRGKWSTCADCHINPASFASFECIFCHEHNRTSMDSKHQGRSGYQYLSSACYRCHPKGSA